MKYLDAQNPTSFFPFLSLQVPWINSDVFVLGAAVV